MVAFTLLLIVLVFLTSHLRPLAADWVAFNGTGEIFVHLGHHVIFKCSGPTGHSVQLHEIGQEMTFEELDFYGDLPHYVNSLHYVPYGCDLSSSLETNCSKLVNLTVTPEVDEKSYKCRSLNRQDNVDKYSPVGTVKVKELIPTPTTVSTATLHVARGPNSTSGDETSPTVLSHPSPTQTPELIDNGVSDYRYHYELTLALVLSSFFFIHL